MAAQASQQQPTTLSAAALASHAALAALDTAHAVIGDDDAERTAFAHGSDVRRRLAPFASSCRPQITLADYAARLCAFTGADGDEVAHAIALALRAAGGNPENITPLAAHRLLGTAFAVTLKITRDLRPLTHEDMCTVIGVHAAEYRYLEAALLRAASFSAHFSLAAAIDACQTIAATCIVHGNVAIAASAAVLKLELPSFRPAERCTASRIASSRASEYAPADAPSAA